MQFYILLSAVLIIIREIKMDEGNYQACVDKYSRKGYQPWQEWSDHYTCHRYRCEIRDGKYFIAAVGCRKPKIPENSLECHEFIEDENVEFPTCCARLRCVIDTNGEKMVTTRGQPGEVFTDKPVKGHQSDSNQAGMDNIPAPMPHAGSGMQGPMMQAGAGMQAGVGMQGGNSMPMQVTNAGRGKINQQNDPVLTADDT